MDLLKRITIPGDVVHKQVQMFVRFKAAPKEILHTDICMFLQGKLY